MSAAARCFEAKDWPSASFHVPFIRSVAINSAMLRENARPSSHPRILSRTLAPSLPGLLPLPPRVSYGTYGISTDWPVSLVAALLAASWLVLSWPWLSGAVTIPWDAKAHFQPQIQFLAASLARGELPFWSPNVFAGQVQVADPQSLIFSPPILLLALIDPAPSLRAVDATILLTLLASGIGVLLVCKDRGWHWAGALVAALAFTFGASMAWRIQHFGQVLSLSYLPFALFFLGRALSRSSAGYGALTGLVASFIVLGRDQVALLSLYVLAGYVVWHWLATPSKARPLRKSVKPLLAGAAVGIALTSVPLILTVLLAEQSNRPSIDFISAGRGSLHPALLITAAIPNLFGAAGTMEAYWGPPSFAWRDTDLFIAQNMGEVYIGALPLLLLLTGLFYGKLWKRDIRFLSAALIGALLYALGWYTPVFRLVYEVLPGVSLYRRPADATFLIGGLAALIAGYVTHLVFTGRLDMLPKGLSDARSQRRLLGIGASVAAIFLLALYFAFRLDRLGMAVKPLMLAVGWIGGSALALGAAIWLKPIRPQVAGSLVVAVVLADLAFNNGPNCATAMRPQQIEMLEPSSRNETLSLLKRKLAETHDGSRRDRVELAGLGFHWPNAAMTHGLEQTLGYNPVRLKLYTDATGAQDSVGLPEQRTFTPLMPSYKSPLADLLGLRFIATGVPVEKIDPKLEPGDLKLIAKTRDGYIYENPTALPRVLFAHDAQTANFGRLMRDGRWPEVDLATTVLLQSPVRALTRRPGSARIITYGNTDIMIESDSPDGGWVVLNDVWHPWWFAQVDGKPAHLQRANVLFRAVEVPRGRHMVQLTFRPLAGALREIVSPVGSDSY